MNKKLIVAMIAAAWGHAALPCGREVVSRVDGGLRSNQTAEIQREIDELSAEGGGRVADAAQKITEEHPARYPAPYFVFESTFPAYAFYLRHADGLRFENVKFQVNDPDEARPPIIADDAIYETLP